MQKGSKCQFWLKSQFPQNLLFFIDLQTGYDDVRKVFDCLVVLRPEFYKLVYDQNLKNQN